MQKSIALKEKYHRTLHQYAGLKRFFERWGADPGFKAALQENAEEALAKHRIPLRPEDIQYMLVEKSTVEFPEPVMKMWNIVHAKNQLIQKFYLNENLPADPGMLAWRKRQINRQRLDLGPFFTDSNIHSSMTVELTQGCSVGCWFCALSPESFKESYRHEEQKEEWRAFLQQMHGFLGNAIKTTFLYWATEPFDNPDYEEFCLDTYEQTGVFPPTTTAVAHRQTDRIREFIKLSAAYDCWLNRFSLTSLGIMSKVHKSFTAEELAEVECLALNKKANFAYGNSGDFRERVKKDPAFLEFEDKKLRQAPWHSSNPDYAESDEYANGSICCVTGFLVNMVSKRIQLISPTTATDEWPLGYIIFAEEHFADISELNAILDKWKKEIFRERLDTSSLLSFHPWLKVQMNEEGVAVKGRFKQRVTFKKALEPALVALVQRIHEQPDSYLQLKTYCTEQLALSAEEADNLIHQLYNRGLFYGH
ncbi:MAG: radical SAM family RiPP maturation amino acid epimerase [Bacteroidota bacterium]